MPFTLWSRGRKLGETELDYVRCFEKHRMGDFHPTEQGEKLMPVITGVAKALHNLARSTEGREDTGAAEYADTSAAQVHFDALGLELRGPDGSVVPTEWIDVRDTEFLLSLVEEHEREEDIFGASEDDEVDPELEAAIEHDLALIEESHANPPEDESWDERPFPRFQIQVGLNDDSAIP